MCAWLIPYARRDSNCRTISSVTSAVNTRRRIGAATAFFVMLTSPPRSYLEASLASARRGQLQPSSYQVHKAPAIARLTECGGGINNFPKDPDDKTPSPILVRVQRVGSTGTETVSIPKQAGDKTSLSSLGRGQTIGSMSDCGAPPSNPGSPPSYPSSPAPGNGGSNPEGNGVGVGVGVGGGGGGSGTEDGGPLPPNADYGRPVSGTMNVVRGGEHSTCNSAGICAPNSVVIKALTVSGVDNDGRRSTFILTDVVLRRVQSAGLVDEGNRMRAWYAFERGEFKQVRVSGSTAQLWYMIRLEMISTFQLQGTDWGGGISQAGGPQPFFYNSAWGTGWGAAEGVIYIPLGPRF